jgi:hypothetical protein
MVQTRFSNAALVELWRRPTALPWGPAYTALSGIVHEAYERVHATGCIFPVGDDANCHVWPVWCWLVSSAPAARIHAGWDARQLRLATEEYLLSLFGGVAGLPGGTAEAQRHFTGVLQVLLTDSRFSTLDRDGPWILDRWIRQSPVDDGDLAWRLGASTEGAADSAPPSLGDWLSVHLGVHQRPMSAWELTMSSVSAFDERGVCRHLPRSDDATKGPPWPLKRSAEALLDVWASDLLASLPAATQQILALTFVFQRTSEETAEEMRLGEKVVDDAVHVLRASVAKVAIEQRMNDEEVMAFVLALKGLLAAQAESRSADGA